MSIVAFYLERKAKGTEMRERQPSARKIKLPIFALGRSSKFFSELPFQRFKLLGIHGSANENESQSKILMRSFLPRDGLWRQRVRTFLLQPGLTQDSNQGKFASSQQRERVEVLIKTSLSKKSGDGQTVLLQLEE